MKSAQGEATQTVKHKASISHDEAMVKELRERPGFAAVYLKAALEDTEEPGILLKAAGVERESLYRALSARGNPRWSTLVAVTKAMGLKLTVESGP